MAQIHVLHENAAWAAPLFDALERCGLPYRDWHLAEGALDLTEAPPKGVFYNRMSASALSGMAALAALLGRELRAFRLRGADASAAA